MTAENADFTPPLRPAGMRLQKYLAAAGLGSRRHCEEYILAGRVTVDGAVADELGVSVDPAAQEVRVDDVIVRPQPRRYYVLNKPPGYLCTNRDPSGRPKAIDLLPDSGMRLFTVGRLDESSTGLLLVTNDGTLAQRLAHPKFQIPRRYVVQVAGRPTPEALAQLREGQYFAEGLFRVTFVRRLKTQGKSTFLEIELKQGQNREIRRLLARVGHKVMTLERVTFGPIKLGGLPLGHFRALRPGELKSLRELNSRGRAPGEKNRSRPHEGPDAAAGETPRSETDAASHRPRRPRSGKAGARGAKRFESKTAAASHGPRGRQSGRKRPASGAARGRRRSGAAAKTKGSAQGR